MILEENKTEEQKKGHPELNLGLIKILEIWDQWFEIKAKIDCMLGLKINY